MAFPESLEVQAGFQLAMVKASVGPQTERAAAWVLPTVVSEMPSLLGKLSIAATFRRQCPVARLLRAAHSLSIVALMVEISSLSCRNFSSASRME
jgi:hypothetical protein